MVRSLRSMIFPLQVIKFLTLLLNLNLKFLKLQMKIIIGTLEALAILAVLVLFGDLIIDFIFIFVGYLLDELLGVGHIIFGLFTFIMVVYLHVFLLILVFF